MVGHRSVHAIWIPAIHAGMTIISTELPSPQPKRGGVCNPAAYVLCELLTQREAQNVSDGITNPVRLRDPLSSVRSQRSPDVAALRRNPG